MRNKQTVSVVCGNPEYFALIKQFLIALANDLNETLKERGVENKNQREQICKEFGVSLGALFDQCWLQVEDRRYYPQLIFTEGFLTEDNCLEEVGEILGPDKVDDFLPLGIWAARTLFEELEEDIGEDVVGNVNDDDVESTDDDE